MKEEPRVKYFGDGGVYWCWLTWVAYADSRVYLYAISMTHKHMKYAVAAAKNRPEVTRHYVEKRIVNHIFGASLVELQAEDRAFILRGGQHTAVEQAQSDVLLDAEQIAERHRHTKGGQG